MMKPAPAGAEERDGAVAGPSGRSASETLSTCLRQRRWALLTMGEGALAAISREGALA
jgi:hypothetical protein